MSVFVVRAFVKLRETASGYKELAAKFTELERKLGTHYQAIASTIAVIRQLMSSPFPRAQADRLSTKTRQEVEPPHDCKPIAVD